MPSKEQIKELEGFFAKIHKIAEENPDDMIIWQKDTQQVTAIRFKNGTARTNR